MGTLVALLLGFELLYWDRVTPGVRALEMDLGGLSREAASERLRDQAAHVLDQSLMLTVGSWRRPTSARDLGLRMDANEIADAAFAVGRVGNPLARLLEQFGALLLGRSVGALGDQDRAATERYLRGVAGELNRQPQNASLSLTPEYRLQFTPAKSGLKLDVSASAEMVSQALAQRQERAELVVKELEPAVRDEMLEPAKRELETMLAGPLVLSFEEQQWRLELPELARLLSLEIRPPAPATVRIDETRLRERLGEIARELNREPRNARFDWSRSGLKVIRESRDGRELDANRARETVLEALRAGQRQVRLPVHVTPPAVPSSLAAQLGVPELIDHGKTSFAGSIEEKKHNIRLAAERLNGVVVPPGGMFSFNKEVGPTTLEAGFKWGFGITSTGEGVKTVPSVAGGICQVATTLFQPVFWAGYQLEERHWHLYWIPAYTSRDVVGLDVTVDEEAGLDFKFINPTPHHLLIQAWTTPDDGLHFGLYGQKPDWKVEVDPAAITNRVPPDPEMVFEAAPKFPWGRRLQVESAREGFDVLVVRRVIFGGEVRTLRLKSSYRPSRNVTLVGTQGAPPGQDVEAVLAQLREAASEQNKPVRGEGEQTDQQPKPTLTPAGQPAQHPAAAPNQATPQATPASTRASTSQPGPTPSPAARTSP